MLKQVQHDRGHSPRFALSQRAVTLNLFQGLYLIVSKIRFMNYYDLPAGEYYYDRQGTCVMRFGKPCSG